MKRFFHAQLGTMAMSKGEPFNLTSKFMPPGQYQSIDRSLQTLKHNFFSGASKRTYTNLSTDEFVALQQ